MAGAVIDLLTKPELLAEAKEEHAKKMQGKTYRCAVSNTIGPPLVVAREQAANQR